MKESQNKEEAPKKSAFQKFKEYMASLAEKAKGTAVGKGFEKLSQTKAYKVLTGKAVGRAIAIGSILAGAAGLMAVAPVALGVMAAGLVTAIAVDTYMTYKTKNLYKEAKMLRDNKVSVEKQKGILDKTPQLSKALEGMLFDPGKEKGKSKDEVSQKKEATILNTIGGAITTAFEKAGGLVNSIISGNPVSMAVGLAGSVVGVIGSAGEKYSMSETRANLRDFIEHEKKKDYSPGYNDKKSLKSAVDKQRIQTLALEKLSKLDGLDKMTDQDIQQKFNEFSKELEVKANKVASRNPIVRFGRRLFKNVIRAHDPFSKYGDATKLHQDIIPQNSEVEKELAQKKELEKQNDVKIKKLAEPVKQSLESSQNSKRSTERQVRKNNHKEKTGGMEIK